MANALHTKLQMHSMLVGADTKSSALLENGFTNGIRRVWLTSLLLVMCSVGAFATSGTNWFMKTSGNGGTTNICLMSNWTQDPTGATSVGTLTTFAPTTGVTVFHIHNIANPTMGSNLTIGGGAGAVTIIVGDSVNAVNFTIPSGFALTNTSAAMSVAANATLTLTNATTPTLGTLDIASTVVYNAASAQNLAGGTYGNLTIASARAKSAIGAVTVNKALIIQSGDTLNMANSVLTAGTSFSLSNSGVVETQVPTTSSTTPLPSGQTWGGTVMYAAGAPEMMAGGTYNTIVLRNSNGATLNGNATASVVTFASSGLFNTGAFSLTVPGSNNSITNTNSSSHITGTLLKTITGLPFLFYEIGTATDYVPVSLALDAAGTGGVLGVTVTQGAEPHAASSNISGSNNVNLYWTLIDNSATGPTMVTPKFGYNADNISGSGAASFAVQKYSGSSWLPVPLPSIYTTAIASVVANNYTGPASPIALSAMPGNYIVGASTLTCNAAPSAGSAYASPSSGQASTVVTLNLAGESIAPGVTYQWQSSASGVLGSFTNISGATNTTYSFTGINANTWYQCNVGCPTYTSATAGTKTVYFTPPFCKPATIGAGIADALAVTPLSFILNGASGSINDTYPSNGTGYMDNAAMTCVLNPATTYTATVNFGPVYPLSAQCWIDFNGDGTFQSTESVGGTASAIASGNNIVLTMPSGLSAGSYRMRVVTDIALEGNVYPTMDPCMSGYQYSEARDYTITIPGGIAMCEGSNATLTDVATGGTWSSTNTAIATIVGSTGVITASNTNSGTVTISYTFSGGGGDSRIVTVNAVPTISSVSPLIGNPSSVVTLTGTSYGGDDVVYFGATRATIATASATSLNVVVPLGATYAPVTVENASCGWTGYSQSSFLPSYNNSAYVPGTVNFDPGAALSNGDYPLGMAIGDIDGDGKPDIVVANSGGGTSTISVYKNISTTGSLTTGSFAAQQTFTVGLAPQDVAIGDIDGDGVPDVAVANYDGSVSVLRNTSTSGTISFATQVVLGGMSSVTGISIGDLDGDGKSDIVAANLYGDNVSVLHNTSVIGSISFETHVDFPVATGSYPYKAVIGDLDGDGKNDIVVQDQLNNKACVFRNTTTAGVINSGSFAAHVDYSVGGNASIILGDIDGDGKQDIISANGGDNTVSVLRNTATSGSFDGTSFASQVTFPVGNAPTWLALGDADGDGKNDVFVLNYTAGTISLLRNTATSGVINSSSFASSVDFPAIASDAWIAVGDLDGDGKADIAVSDNQSFTISVYRNDPLQPISGSATICTGGATITLSDGAHNGIWSSGATGVATVGSLTGVVTAVTGGTAVITYAGSAGVSYTGNFVTKIVTVNVGPSSTGASNSSPICPGSGVTLNDNSTNATGWLWQGTDGTSSTLQSPTMTPTTTTTYSLTVSNTNGCVNATLYTTTVTVNVVPSSTGAGNSGPVCSGAGVTLNDNSTNATGWSWHGSDGSSSATQSPVMTPTATTTYSLTVSNTDGCANATVYTTTVTVNSAPSSVTATAAPITVYVGSSVTLTGTATNATNYLWAGPGGAAMTSTTTLSTAITSVTTGNTGIYTLTAANSCGTVTATTAALTVIAVPTLSGSTTCPFSVLTVTSSATPTEIIWKRGGVGISTVLPTYPSGIEVAGTSTVSGTDAAHVKFPNSVFVRNGSVYVADEANNRIMQWAPGATTGVEVAGTGITAGTDATHLSFPVGVSVDASGNIYVADGSNNRIQKFAAGSTVGTTVGSGLSAPTALFVDGSGNIYVSENSTRVQKFTPGVTAGTVVAAGLTYAAGVYVDGNGNIYVTDGSAAKVQKFVPGSTTGTVVVSSGLSSPAGISVDASGNIYVADNSLGRILRYAAGSSIGTIIIGSSTGHGSNQLDEPAGIYVDSAIDIYVADFGNNRVQEFSPTMTTTVTAGVAGNYTALVTTAAGSVTTNTVTINASPAAGSITGPTTVVAGSNISLTDAATGGVWSSVSTAIGTVSTGGVVTGISGGTTTISYTVSNGCGTVAATAIVTVTPAPAATVWYSKSSGNLDELTTWGASTDGSGANPTDFTTSGMTYNIVNNTAPTLGAAWNPAGTINLGDGSDAINFTIPSGFAYGGDPINVFAGATLTITNTTVPSLGFLDAASTVVYNSSSSQTISSATYGNLTVGDGGSVVTYPAAGALTVKGALTTANTGATLNMGSYQLSGALSSINNNGTIETQATGSTPIPSGMNWGDSRGIVLYDNTTTSQTIVAGSYDTLIVGGASGTVTYNAGGDITASRSLQTALTTTTLNMGTNRVLGFVENIFNNGTFETQNTSSLPFPAEMAWSNDPGTVLYDGTAAQTIPNGSYVNFTINNNAGASLSGDIAITGVLNFVHGIINSNGNNFGMNGTVSGAGAGNYVEGALQEIVPFGTNPVMTFPVGDALGYAPMQLSITGSFIMGSIGVTANSGLHPQVATSGLNSSAIVNHYWTLSNDAMFGITSAIPQVTYNAGDVIGGNNSAFVMQQYNGSSWLGAPVAATNTISPYTSAPNTGITSLAGDYIFGNAGASFSTVAGSSLCVGTHTTLTDATSGGTWSSDNTGVATIIGSTGVVTGAGNGTATISYVFSGGGGDTRVVTVNVTPTSTGATNSGAVCSGNPVTLFDNSTNATGWSWHGSNGSSSTMQSPTMTPTATTTYSLTLTNTNGCSSTTPYTTTVTINTTNTGTITGPTSVTQGLNITLTDAVSGGSWSAGNGNATVTDGVVNGVSVGSVTISYAVTGSCGTAYATKLITVNSSSISGISGPGTVCQGKTITLTDATSGGTWHSNNILVATVSGSGVVGPVRAGTAIISYTVGGITTTTTITVLTNPTFITGPYAECIGQVVTLSDTSSGGSWASSSPNATVDESGNVSGTVAGNYTITYTISNGCFATYPMAVHSNPSPMYGTFIMCAGATATVFDSTATSLSYTSNTPSVATVTNAGVITGVSGGTSNITYTLSTGCITTQVITVNALPVITGNSGSICAGTTLQLSDSPTGGTWLSGNTGVATVGTTGLVSAIAGGTVAITYTNTAGCKTKSVVTVNAISPITGALTVNSGASVTLSDATTGGTWSSDNTGNAIVGSSTGVVTGEGSGGVADITYLISSGCFRTVTVTVNPAPTSITGSGTICQGYSATLTNATSGGTWSSSNVLVATVSSTGVVTGSTSRTGVVTISYTLAGGTVTHVMTINQNPGFIAGAYAECVGQTVILSDTTAGGNWTSNNENIAISGTGAVLSVTGETAGSSRITYTVPSTGCYVTYPMAVNPNPTSIYGTFVVCVGATAILNDTSGVSNTFTSNTPSVATIANSGVMTGVSAGTSMITFTMSTGCYTTQVVTVNPSTPTISGNTHAICPAITLSLSDTYGAGTWSSNNNTVASAGTDGTVTGLTAGTAVITYVPSGTSGCATTTIVTVNPAPAISGPGSVCVNATITLTNTAPGAWSTTSSNASVGSSGVVTGQSAGTAAILYTTGGGCVITNIVTVNSLPATISGALAVCTGNVTSLSDGTTPGTWSAATGNVTVDGSGNVAGVTAGTAMLTYTSAGCFITAIVTVNQSPSAILGATTVCSGSVIHLSDAIEGGTWDVDVHASVDASGNVMGLTPGTAIVSYSLGGLCRITSAVNVSISPTAFSGLGMCSGPGTTLSDAPSGGIWSSGNSSVVAIGSSTGTLTGVSGGTANVTYTVGSNCSASAVVTVNAVLPITGILSVNSGSSVTLSDATLGGTWSSDNTGTATVGSTTGIVTGTGSGGLANITYLSAANCSQTVAVTVNPAATPITGSSIICQGFPVAFTDATPGGTWSSNNILVATVSSTGVVTGSITRTGVATISYTYGSVTVTEAVTVSANPAFITGVYLECLGATVTLSDVTPGGNWTSNNTNVTLTGSGSVIGVTGSILGNSTITYTMPSTGCFVTYPMAVDPNPTPIFGTFAVCAGSTVTLRDTSMTGESYTSSAPSIATANNTGLITGVSAGTTTITYTINTGCITTQVITVNPLPVITGNTASICVAATMQLTDAVSGGTWATSNGSIANVGLAGLVTAAASGTVTITNHSAAGCASSTIVTVNPVPVINGALSLCAGGSVTLSDIIGGGTWGTSDASIATVGSATGIVTGEGTGGIVQITYTAASSCTNTVTVNVSSSATPISGPGTIVCLSHSTTLTDATPGGTWSSSSSLVASVSSTGVVTGSATRTGAFTISYSLGSGCLAVYQMTANANPANITGTTAECVGATVTLSDASGIGAWTSNNANVTVDGSGKVLGNVAGTSIITYSQNGCYVTYPMSVRANPVPMTGTFNVCMGTTAYVYDASTVSQSYRSSNTGVATITNAGAITPVTTGTSTITYTINTGCYITQDITVNALPVVAAISGPPSISHHGIPAVLTESTPGGVWTSSNSTVIALSGAGSGSVTATAVVTAGSAIISYTVTNPAGCSARATKTISVTTRESGSSNVTTSVYAGSTVSIAGDVYTGTWTSGDDNIATVDGKGNVTGVKPGVVNITLVSASENGDVQTTTTSVIVSAIPVSVSVIPNPNNGNFSVKGSMGSLNDEDLTLEVTDVLGQVIYRSVVTTQKGKLNETISLNSSLANGMYMLNVRSANEKIVFHFVVER